MVGAADERPRLDVPNAPSPPLVLEREELFRRIKSRHGELVAGGAEVLADGDDFDAGPGKVAEHLEYFFECLAQADHEPGFGGNLGRDLARAAEQSEGALVARAAPGRSVKPRHGFDVVVQHVRTRGHYDVQRGL